MIISACGTGYSGSGAIIDLLKEYEENKVIDGHEFSLLYTPDGVADLDYHLNYQNFRYFSSDTAIRRFKRLIDILSSGRSPYMKETKGNFRKISYDYIESLTQCTWRGTGTGDLIDLPWFTRKFKYSFLQRLQNYSDNTLHSYHEIRPQRLMALSIKPSNFDKLTYEYMNSIFSAICSDQNCNLVLDQLFPGNCPSCCYKYVKDPFGIAVYRDPRDLYILGKTTLHTKARFMPLDDVKVFTEYYQTIHQILLNEKHDKTLLLRFEDLIFDYDSKVHLIEHTLGLDNHVSPKKYFNPQISVNNTALFLSYPEYENEIKYIEDHLKEWLYPFDTSIIPKKRGQMF